MKKELEKDYLVYIKKIEADYEERIKSIELMDRDISKQFILDLKNDQDNMIRSLKNELNWDSHYYHYKDFKSIDSDYLNSIFNIQNKQKIDDMSFFKKVIRFFSLLSEIGEVMAIDIESMMLSIFKAKSTHRKDKKTLLKLIVSLKFILPKRYREEYSTDIVEIYQELRNEGHSKFYCYFFTGLNVLNVLWSALRFKYDDYFSKERSVSKKS